tara:strand:+ start:1743 stop:2210 length:468 start_codon:yes stop_codon:yes gene_type:complete
MVSRIYNNSDLAHVLASTMHIKKGILPALALTFSLTLGATAWSYEQSVRPAPVSSSPSAAVDVCQSLLNTPLHTPSAFASVENQRTAGKIAAFGMLLGARFAQEPDSIEKSYVIHAQIDEQPRTTAHKNNRSAQAIAAYRQCHKAQVLNHLASVD